MWHILVSLSSKQKPAFWSAWGTCSFDIYKGRGISPIENMLIIGKYIIGKHQWMIVRILQVTILIVWLFSNHKQNNVRN